MKKNISILFLGKKGNAYVEKAVKFCQKNFPDIEIYIGWSNEPLPEDVGWWKGDYIVSFLSNCIVPDYLLKRAESGAINFHPASPDYPGIGCYNFALYDKSSDYGAMCHHMDPKVDSGDIIAVKRFPVYPSDNIESLIERTYDNLIVLFYEVMSEILNGSVLPKSSEQWKNKAKTREELNDLATITFDMNNIEIDKRVIATTYGNWKPNIQLGDYLFELKN
jgi:methionyl-tRNA formyltransferase